MQDDHITRLNPAAIDATDFDMADDLMLALGETGLDGMSVYQERLVKKMGEMLAAAVARIDAIQAASGFQVSMLVTKAANHALAMRIHGATLRGDAGAGMLEDLCDAVMGRYAAFEPVAVQKPVVQKPAIPKDCLTVEEAMRMLKCRTLVELADMIGSTAKTCSRWRDEGHMREKASATVRALYRGMQVRAAA